MQFINHKHQRSPIFRTFMAWLQSWSYIQIRFILWRSKEITSKMKFDNKSWNRCSFNTEPFSFCIFVLSDSICDIKILTIIHFVVFGSFKLDKQNQSYKRRKKLSHKIRQNKLKPPHKCSKYRTPLNVLWLINCKQFSIF